jgi:phage/conjugal plasmid C-4 type zinc finger TraR family protein
MAGGWAKDGAIQEQIDASVEDAVKRARDQLTSGESLTNCQECGEPIPAARRAALAGVRRCVACQAVEDSAQEDTTLINRRASKDSQLR